MPSHTKIPHPHGALTALLTMLSLLSDLALAGPPKDIHIAPSTTTTTRTSPPAASVAHPIPIQPATATLIAAVAHTPVAAPQTPVASTNHSPTPASVTQSSNLGTANHSATSGAPTSQTVAHPSNATTQRSSSATATTSVTPTAPDPANKPQDAKHTHVGSVPQVGTASTTQRARASTTSEATHATVSASAASNTNSQPSSTAHPPSANASPEAHSGSERPQAHPMPSLPIRASTFPLASQDAAQVTHTPPPPPSTAENGTALRLRGGMNRSDSNAGNQQPAPPTQNATPPLTHEQVPPTLLAPANSNSLFGALGSPPPPAGRQAVHHPPANTAQAPAVATHQQPAAASAGLVQPPASANQHLASVGPFPQPQIGTSMPSSSLNSENAFGGVSLSQIDPRQPRAAFTSSSSHNASSEQPGPNISTQTATPQLDPSHGRVSTSSQSQRHHPYAPTSSSQPIPGHSELPASSSTAASASMGASHPTTAQGAFNPSLSRYPHMSDEDFDVMFRKQKVTGLQEEKRMTRPQKEARLEEKQARRRLQDAARRDARQSGAQTGGETSESAAIPPTGTQQQSTSAHAIPPQSAPNPPPGPNRYAHMDDAEFNEFFARGKYTSKPKEASLSRTEKEKMVLEKSARMKQRQLDRQATSRQGRAQAEPTEPQLTSLDSLMPSPPPPPAPRLPRPYESVTAADISEHGHSSGTSAAPARDQQPTSATFSESQPHSSLQMNPFARDTHGSSSASAGTGPSSWQGGYSVLQLHDPTASPPPDAIRLHDPYAGNPFARDTHGSSSASAGIGSSSWQGGYSAPQARNPTASPPPDAIRLHDPYTATFPPRQIELRSSSPDNYDHVFPTPPAQPTTSTQSASQATATVNAPAAAAGTQSPNPWDRVHSPSYTAAPHDASGMDWETFINSLNRPS